MIFILNREISFSSIFEKKGNFYFDKITLLTSRLDDNPPQIKTCSQQTEINNLSADETNYTYNKQKGIYINILYIIIN